MANGTPHSAETRLRLRLMRLEKSMPPEEFARFMASDGALKWCAACEQLLPVGEFYRNRRTWDGLTGYCKQCCSEKKRATYRKHCDDPEYRERRRQRTAEWRATARANGTFREFARKYRLKKFSLTPDSFQAMLAAQRYRCAICREPFTSPKQTHIDHDHACCPGDQSCGKCIRGVLCGKCNVALGGFRDDPAILRHAIRYLKRDCRSEIPPVAPDTGQGALWDGDAA